MLLKLATAALLPAIVIQGRHVKKNTPRLAEPIGERSGVVGTGPKLKLLILGDSAAAGVGVEHQDHALLGALLGLLKADFEVHYQLIAKTGRNSAQVLQAAQALQPQAFDIVVTSVGVNDVTQLKQPKQWLRQQQYLYQVIQQRFQAKMVILSGVPPMEQFPALPHPLAWIMGSYARHMNQLLGQWVATQRHLDLIEYDLNEYRALNLSMAEDGFHPSREIYQLWASKIAALIKTAQLTQE